MIHWGTEYPKKLTSKNQDEPPEIKNMYTPTDPTSPCAHFLGSAKNQCLKQTSERTNRTVALQECGWQGFVVGTLWRRCACSA